jgi:hypothetical protein
VKHLSLNLDEEAYRRASHYAIDHDLTFTGLVAAALEAFLAPHRITVAQTGHITIEPPVARDVPIKLTATPLAEERTEAEMLAAMKRPMPPPQTQGVRTAEQRRAEGEAYAAAHPLLVGATRTSEAPTPIFDPTFGHSRPVPKKR